MSWRRLLSFVWLGFTVAPAWAGETAQDLEAGASAGAESIVPFLFWMVVILVAAKFGGEVFERCGQPAVLGELVAGIVLGNMGLFGVTFLESLKENSSLEMIAQIGVILLLFEVGLESHLKELIAVGPSALLVGCLGVAGPMALGFGVSYLFLAGMPWFVHLFVGATLSATSVGLTARVLRDLGKTETKEARIILGGAVIDDVLGLIIVAVASGIILSIAQGGRAEFALGPAAWIIAKAIIFLAAAVVVGRAIHVTALRVGAHFRVPGVPLVFAICHCFSLAALAGWVGLAPIVGAFAGGLVLEDYQYREFLKRGEQPIGDLIRPLSTIFVPVFFVLMGLRVDLTAFASPEVLLFAAALTLAAVAGKQVCAAGVLEKGVSRITVGVGMIPRGEVALIFTSIGAGLVVAGEPVFSSTIVSAMVVMVAVTALLTPPLLKLFFERASNPLPEEQVQDEEVFVGSSKVL